MRHLAATFMCSAITLLVNLFEARIWISISVSKKETRALRRALNLVSENFDSNIAFRENLEYDGTLSSIIKPSIV